MKKTKYINEIFSYLLVFIATLAILFLGLTLTATIPKSKIEDNLKKSATYLEKNSGIKRLQPGREYTYLHLYADSVVLNIINCVDTNKPIKSIMWDNYYETIKMDVNNDFIEAVKENKKPNQQYIRYWHGSMIILRPLLMIISLEQMYQVNYILLIILAIALLIMIWKKSKKIAIAYIISMIMIAFPIIAMCLEFVWTFYIMFISSIIAINIKKDKNLYKLFLIIGMITCFFDFLTTEIITLFVPLLIILAIKKEKDEIQSFKEGAIIFLKSCILWFVGYAGMWIAKWTLASIILNINALEYVKDQALLRVNGLQGLDSAKKMYVGAITQNWHTLYPINSVKRTSSLWLIIAIFVVFFAIIIDWKKIKNNKSSLILLVIAIMPYIRYLVLANHSYRHSFFTFRSQIITIMAVTYFILDNSRLKDKIKQVANTQINIKGKNKNE